MTTHELKTEYHCFQAVKAGDKPFEVRYNDRFYQKGDILVLKCLTKDATTYSHAEQPLRFRVTFVLSGERWGLRDGFVALGMQSLKDAPKEHRVLSSPLYKYLVQMQWNEDIAYDAAKEYLETGDALEAAVRVLHEDDHLHELHEAIKEFVISTTPIKKEGADV